MKKTVFATVVLLLLVGCSKPLKLQYSALHFTDEVRLRTTPVKDQGRSSLCWVYAMLATIETEHLMQGDSVNLSPDYVARMYLMEQVKQRLMTRSGKTASANNGATITTRGMAGMLINLIQTYGIHRFDAYHKRNGAGYDVIERKLNQAVLSAQTSDLATKINRI